MAPTPQQSKSTKAAQLAGKVKPSKARVQRYLKKTTEPQLREPAKSTLLLRGIRTNEGLNALLQELRAVAAPNSKMLSKKNNIVAFDGDGQQSLEFLCTKNDCSLFGMVAHNKKRPNRLAIGRLFDHQLLDLCELTVRRFKSMKDYGGTVPKKRVGSKPLLLFVGDAWQLQEDYRQLQNLLADFYRGDVVDKLVLGGIDHLIVFTAAAAAANSSSSSSSPSGGITIHQRTYFCKLKKNPNSTGSDNNGAPVPYLEACGPDLDLTVSRTQWCTDPDLYKASRKLPTALRTKKKKNRSTTLFGETIGRLHLARQDVEKSTGRKSKALRRAEKEAKREELGGAEEELQREGTELKEEFKQTFGFEDE